jgi:FkbH-like protein
MTPDRPTDLHDAPTRVLTLSDFNADNFRALLVHDPEAPAVESVPAPFGQVERLLLDAGADGWSPPPDCVVVWTRPQGAIRAFERALAYEPFAIDEVLAEVDQLVSLLTTAAERARTLLVPTWVLPAHERGLGVLDHRRGLGLADLLARMNQRLSERLAGVPGCYLLDAQRWLQQAGARAYNPKAWYMGKIAFGNEVFQAAVADVKAALRAVGGQARKLVLLDLDDTLWGGIVGDVGWENLVLGGHDAEGEALVDFQRGLKALTQRGVLLGVVSKNTEEIALEAIRRHPEMVLGIDDLAGWRIGWGDKARGIVELAAELNLGLQSVVFIDDNPAERARVRDALPEVLVPEWPTDKTHYRVALARLTCFDSVALTDEDRRRADMYAGERRRRAGLVDVGSVDEWLATLETQVRIEPLDRGNLARAAQLLNKTNQMNLSTRRLAEDELLAWASQDGHRFWTFRVSDRFGDLGLVGLLGVDATGEPARIVDLVLSCRVMGRKVEETMVATAVRDARVTGRRGLEARYRPTARNGPCLDFLERSGLARGTEERVYRWDSDRAFPFPAQVTVLEAGE